MSYSISDPRYEELLAPGQKPIGPNKAIDWSHPLTRGLISVVLPGLDNIDLVTKKLWLPTNVTKEVIKGRGMGYHSIRLNESKLTSQTAFPANVVDEFTVAHDVYIDDLTTTWKTWWVLDKSAYAGGAFVQHFTAGIEYFIGSSAKPASTTLEIDTLYDFAFTNNNAANDRKVYKNGIFLRTDVSATAPAGDNTAQLFVADNLATNRSQGGTTSYWYLWYRELSPEEILSIKLNPFQFLIPA